VRILGAAGASRDPDFTRDDAAELCGRLASLLRAGLAPERIWAVLAEGRGTPARVAETVAGMVAVGGSAAEGLRLARARTCGNGVEVLGWLATTMEVIQRSGAPAATVLDGVGTGLLAQVVEREEREVALAGPRATALVLACLPLAGLVLGLLAGVNPVTVLLGTAGGRACAVAGGLLWVSGRRWSGRLIAATEQEPT
jgi:tight adherence protein B